MGRCSAGLGVGARVQGVRSRRVCLLRYLLACARYGIIWYNSKLCILMRGVNTGGTVMVARVLVKSYSHWNLGRQTRWAVNGSMELQDITKV